MPAYILIFFSLISLSFTNERPKSLYDYIRPDDRGAISEMQEMFERPRNTEEFILDTGSTQALKAESLTDVDEAFLFYYDISLMAEDIKPRTILVYVLLSILLGFKFLRKSYV